MDYASNLLSRYQSALPFERETGALWYRQAHSLARVLGVVAGIPTPQSAAILAALSPMNDWLSNVSDAFNVARYGANAIVRTPHINKRKALRILGGEDAEGVLGGRKVRAFWRGIADPHHSTSIAVDRHLYRAAMGVEIRGRDAAPKDNEYDDIEKAFGEVGREVGETAVGVASTVWLVMRRLDNPTQRSLEF